MTSLITCATRRFEFAGDRGSEISETCPGCRINLAPDVTRSDGVPITSHHSLPVALSCDSLRPNHIVSPAGTWRGMSYGFGLGVCFIPLGGSIYIHTCVVRGYGSAATLVLSSLGLLRLFYWPGYHSRNISPPSSYSVAIGIVILKFTKYPLYDSNKPLVLS